MLLAFSDYAIAVVAAEVGEPAFRDTPHAVSFGGAEVFLIQPPLHRAEVISEKLGDLSVGSGFGSRLHLRRRKAVYFLISSSVRFRIRGEFGTVENIRGISYVCRFSRQVMTSSRRIVYCLVFFPLSLQGSMPL